MNVPFEIEVVDADPRVVVLRATGRLDSHTAGLLTEECERIQRSARHLVLNLAGITFIASSGVGALLAAAEDFRLVGCGMRIAEAAPSVKAVLHLLNLGEFLLLDSSEQSAVETLKAA